MAEKFCNKLLSANDETSKNIIFAGELNIKVLGYEYNKKVQHLPNRVIQV